MADFGIRIVERGVGKYFNAIRLFNNDAAFKRGIVLVEDGGIAINEGIFLAHAHISAEFLQGTFSFNKIFDHQGGFNFQFLGTILLQGGNSNLCLRQSRQQHDNEERDEKTGLLAVGRKIVKQGNVV